MCHKTFILYAYTETSILHRYGKLSDVIQMILHMFIDEVIDQRTASMVADMCNVMGCDVVVRRGIPLNVPWVLFMRVHYTHHITHVLWATCIG